MRVIPKTDKALVGIPAHIRATVEETEEAMLLTAEFPHNALTLAIKLEWFAEEEEKVKDALRVFREEIEKKAKGKASRLPP